MDKVEAVVTGRVKRTFQAKNGVGAVIAIARVGKNNAWEDEIKCWGIDLPLGETVTVSGNISWRNSKFEKKDGTTVYGIEVSLNDCQQVA